MQYSKKDLNDCPIGTTGYIIQPNDTLYNIARKFNTAIPFILFFNPFIKPLNLKVGEKICIPTGDQPICENGLIYTIKPGDTLYSISSEFNVTIDNILSYNYRLDPYNLIIGRKICIPTKKAPIECPENSDKYLVKSDDTLSLILVKYDYPYSVLVNYNKEVDFENLKPGTELCIPSKEQVEGCPFRTYSVKNGDNLLIISEKFKVSTDKLLISNFNLKPSDFEVPDMKICIPEGV